MSTDYRDSVPIVIPPPSKEFKGDGEPLYPDKFPDLVEKKPEPEESQ